MSCSGLCAGYRRAAAGVMGCILVGGVLGLAFHERQATVAALSAEPVVLLQSVREPAVPQPDLSAASPVYLSLGSKGNAQLFRDRHQRRVVIYVVKSGDTLWDIATAYNTDVSSLLSLNPKVQPEVIQPGQKLRVASNFRGAAHDVQQGDTLSSIAAAYGITVQEIVQTNGLASDAMLAEGDLLLLPGARLRVWRNTVASRNGSRREFAPPPPDIQNGWTWPIIGGLHTTEFSGRHPGLDIAIETGTEVVAARAGTVTFSGWDGGYGYCVLIDHGDGFVTRYAHASLLLVRKGEPVATGQPVIQVGSTGNSTGPHLHFEMVFQGQPVSPKAYLP